MHHGSFSSVSAEETLAGINGRLKSAHERLDRLDCLLLTFGSAWVYENEKTGTVVANCHKQPESCFTRRMLSVSEIVSDYTSLLSGLLARIPRLKVLFTVSPIRHVRDGMHANQLSKATLLLAVNQLQATFPEHVFYFPAYELLLDELRDYRFYAEDMVHPSETAIRYVWERFTRSCISADALRIMEESENIRKMLSHKPFYPASEEYKRFLGQIVLKIDQLNGKYPPPYEVLQTREISVDELQTAHYLSRLLDGFYNTPTWRSITRILILENPHFIHELLDHLVQTDVIDTPLSLEKRGFSGILSISCSMISILSSISSIRTI